MLGVPDVLGQVLVDRLADDPVEALQPRQPDPDGEVGVVVLDVAHGGEALDEEVVAAVVGGRVLLDLREGQERRRGHDLELRVGRLEQLLHRLEVALHEEVDGVDVA